MYVAIRQYRISPTAVDEVTRQVQEGFLPLIRQTPGFVEYYWLNAGNGYLVSLSIFQDQAAAEASTELAAEYIRQHLATLVRNPPDVTEGEVLIHQVG
jgi:quinol monooxygenase YgiN